MNDLRITQRGKLRDRTINLECMSYSLVNFFSISFTNVVPLGPDTPNRVANRKTPPKRAPRRHRIVNSSSFTHPNRKHTSQKKKDICSGVSSPGQIIVKTVVNSTRVFEVTPDVYSGD